MKKLISLFLSLVLALSLLPAAVLAEETPILISAPAMDFTLTDETGKTVTESADTWRIVNNALHIVGDNYTLSGDCAYPVFAEESVKTLTLDNFYLNSSAVTDGAFVGMKLCGDVLLKLKGSNTVILPTPMPSGEDTVKKSFALNARALSVEAEKGASLRLNAAASDLSIALNVEQNLSVSGGSYSFTASETKYGESCAVRVGSIANISDCRLFLQAGVGLAAEQILWISESVIDSLVSDAAVKADEAFPVGLTLRFSLRKNGDQPTGIEARELSFGTASIFGAPACPSVRAEEPISHVFAPECVTKLICDGKIIGSFEEENELCFIGAERTETGCKPAGDAPMTIVGLPEIYVYKEWKEDSFDYLDDPAAGQEIKDQAFYTLFWTNFETAPKLKLVWLDEHKGITLKLKDGALYLTVSKDAEVGEYDFRIYADDYYCDTTLAVLPELAFTDIRIGETFYNDIAFCVENGLMKGISETAFAPEKTTNRRQVWMALARMAGETPANMEEAKQWAVKNGISDGSDPTKEVSRQQLAAMLYRYAKLQDKGFTGAWMFLLDAPDRGEIGGYAYEAMCWCKLNGILNGGADGALYPRANASRGNVAAMLHRFARAMEK